MSHESVQSYMHRLVAGNAGGCGTLIERAAETGRADDRVGEVARLQISDRIHRPRPAMHQPDARILPPGAAVRPAKTQRSVIAEHEPAHLQLRQIIERRDCPNPDRPVAIASPGRCGHALGEWRREETITALEPAGKGRKTAAEIGRKARGDLLRIVAAVKGTAVHPRQVAPRRADQFDRPRHCACAERPRAAAARHPHRRQPVTDDRGEGNMPEKRFGHRHPVEQHQRPAGGIAAQRPQRHTLRCWVGGSAVRSAKLLKPGDIAEHIFDPTRGITRQSFPLDHDRSIGRRTRWQRQIAIDDDNVFDRQRRHGLSDARRTPQRQAAQSRGQMQRAISTDNAALLGQRSVLQNADRLAGKAQSFGHHRDHIGQQGLCQRRMIGHQRGIGIGAEFVKHAVGLGDDIGAARLAGQ